jgi:hypothetical protein
MVCGKAVTRVRRDLPARKASTRSQLGTQHLHVSSSFHPFGHLETRSTMEHITGVMETVKHFRVSEVAFSESGNEIWSDMMPNWRHLSRRTD